MRHYYRFMELEPVLEMEEDSAGDAGSPTSSTGSPSLSPPPDVWAQLSGKEYQDSAYNLLLQDHLELQRAYRLLEVQYRNCETRASRNIGECMTQVRNLKDTLKEVLITQESDKLHAIKEDLQRAKERETRLKEEAYDLKEQNELLEFRILELEECHENTSLRSMNHETRDVGTDMTVEVALIASAHIEEKERAYQSLVTAALGNESEIGCIHHGPATNEESPDKNVDVSRTQRLESDLLLAPNTATVQSSIHHPTESNQQCPDLEVESISQPDITPHATSYSSESISCTLCRRLPRRRSLPAGVDNQRETLRKSKSDGAIKLIAELKRLESLEGIKRLEENRREMVTIECDDQLKTMKDTLKSIHDILKETRIEVECTNSELREEVVTLETTVINLTKDLSQRRDSKATSDDGMPLHKLLRRSSSLSSSQECHCCSQELRPALEVVINKLQQVTDLVNHKELSIHNETTPLLADGVDLVELPAAINQLQVPETPVVVQPEVDQEVETGRKERSTETIIVDELKREVRKNVEDASIRNKFSRQEEIFTQLMEAKKKQEENNKPVLRRWNEHLIKKRQDRAKSWSAGALDFPKNLHTAIVL